jgi:hypothetical protein
MPLNLVAAPYIVSGDLGKLRRVAMDDHAGEAVMGINPMTSILSAALQVGRPAATLRAASLRLVP